MASLLLTIHIVAAVYRVGGMAFAYTVLRPAVGPLEAEALGGRCDGGTFGLLDPVGGAHHGS